VTCGGGGGRGEDVHSHETNAEVMTIWTSSSRHGILLN
jgi:hypothetical protein